ncbi:hypothetical protein N431DRAFT_488713 [Stipitochalara longipes BDJ]|nr:hypothetical protein N431DRAFT_488713 [Stipitochalara longipes BDJ]
MSRFFNPLNQSIYAQTLRGANLIYSSKPPPGTSSDIDGNEDADAWSPKGRAALASMMDLGLLHARARIQGFVEDDRANATSTSKTTNLRGLLGYQVRQVAAPRAEDLEEAGVTLEEAVEKGMDIGVEDGRLDEEAEWLARLQVRELVPNEKGGEMGDRYWKSFGKRYYLSHKCVETSPSSDARNHQVGSQDVDSCNCDVCNTVSERYRSLSLSTETKVQSHLSDRVCEERQQTSSNQMIAEDSLKQRPQNLSIIDAGVDDDAWTDKEDEIVLVDTTRPEGLSHIGEWEARLGDKEKSTTFLTPSAPEGQDKKVTQNPPTDNHQIDDDNWDRAEGVDTSTSPADQENASTAAEPQGKTPEFPAGSITIEVYGEVVEIGLDRLFTFFWRNIPDGPCEVCGGNFNDEKGPPIRTMSAGPGRFIIPEMTEWPNFYIRVHNRHLDCIEKCHIPIIPVSHVWSEGVARANVEQKVNVDAIYEVFFRPLSILKAATSRFFEVLRAPIEIWHDYFSIPQFCHDIKERLLLALPEIFRVAPFCLIDLDDIPSTTIRDIFPISGEENVPNLMHRLSCISKFFSARWFKRMWVNLEYAFCQRACVLTSDNCILFWDGAKETRDSFSLFRVHAALEGREIDMQMSLILPPHLYSQYKQQTQSYTILGPSTYRRLKTGNGDNLTYGEALEHLSRLDCRDYRDRFIAMAGMLSIGSYRDTTLAIPKDDAAACLWVAQGCLRRGDHSPLLLTPCEEQPLLGARWLIGHEKMCQTMCYLGRQTHPPKSLSILDKDTDQIKFKMQSVGSVILSWHVDFSRGDDFINFNIVAEEILSTTGPIARDFVSAILRVYCVPLYMVDPEIPNSLAEYEALEDDFVTRLEKLLGEYGNAINVDDTNEICRISELMIELLRLTRPYRSNIHTKHGAFTKLMYAGSFSASQYYRDSIDLVECASCEKAFVYRLYHYTGGKDMLNAEVYRIQGLGYEGTLPDGVGLVVKNGRVVGKMVYGTPACQCQVMRVVTVS